MQTRTSFFLFLFAATIHPVLAADPPHLVRQHYLPARSEHGASWSKLRPEPDQSGGMFLQAWAGVGEKFPVEDPAGQKLFEVQVIEGDDDHLLFEIASEDPPQRLGVKRDHPESLTLAGIHYVLAYPSVSVSSEGKSVVHQAMILVSRPAANAPAAGKALPGSPAVPASTEPLSYETPDQIKAMPPCTASVLEIGSCYASLRATDGKTLSIGSPAAPRVVVEFIATLKEGESYPFPAAFVAFTARSFDLSSAPQAIQELAASIQGKSPDQIREAILKRFGPVQRDVGSGSRIEQWDTSGGVLTFHLSAGPSFFDPATRHSYRLLHTSNPAGANLLQNYEMTTLPDAANHGSRAWLGNLGFESGSRYQFTDSGQFPELHKAQKRNFFMLHPRGTVEVRYTSGATAETLLESMPEGGTVAELVFTPADQTASQTFSIASSERERRLVFTDDDQLSFCLKAGWKESWH